MPPLAYNLIHAALWQAAWFAAVLGAAHGLPWLGPAATVPVLALHAWRHRQDRDRGWTLPVAALGLGLIVDSLLGHLAGLRMARGDTAWTTWATPWMAVLWIQLATALTASLAWLPRRPALAAVLGAVCGPLAYYGGVRLGALSIDGWPTLLAVSAVWAVALPLLAACTRIPWRRTHA